MVNVNLDMEWVGPHEEICFPKGDQIIWVQFIMISIVEVDNKEMPHEYESLSISLKNNAIDK